ncbi:hypothetical protein AB0L40_20710 [Patulibacter sp. NPDC049589]|uniref:hypothetical protein n=1 Tax=Patulibacter sp. NPDC049589 TaxID=3154731 RepID=UPI00344A8450
MTTFRVDLDDLRSLARTLDHAANDLREMDRQRGGLDGDAGAADVEGAVHGFIAHWSDATGRIARSLDALSLVTEKSHDAYAAADGTVAAASAEGGRRMLRP